MNVKELTDEELYILYVSIGGLTEDDFLSNGCARQIEVQVVGVDLRSVYKRSTQQLFNLIAEEYYFRLLEKTQ